MRTLTGHPSRGFAMLEVLIACLFIVSGVLGISVLFARALAQGRSALYRMSAVYLAEDLAESIRANAAGGEAYAASATSSAAPCPDTCSPEALAASDLAAWQARIRDELSAPGTPSVEGHLAAAPHQTNHFRVQVLWSEPDAGEPLIATSDLILAPAAGEP